MAKRVGMREFRAKLKQAIEGTEVLEIGTDYQVRAVLIPIPRFDRWEGKSKAKAMREYKQRVREAAKLGFDDGWGRVQHL